MKTLAVDIVLLPDETMTEKAIEANRQLINVANQKIVLNKQDSLPHISLMMGLFSQQDLPQLKEILEQLSQRYLPLTLEVDEIASKSEDNGETTTVFNIRHKRILQQLHEEVIEQLRPLMKEQKLGRDMMYQPEKVDESCFEWIENFLDHHSFEHYSPHITIGLGNLEEVHLPVAFQSSRLVACQLGNYCTCGKIL